MQIDRSRFLMLTASIAASGCAGSQPQAVEVPEQTVVVIAPPPPQPAGSASAAPALEPDDEPQAELVAPAAEEDDEEALDPADRALAAAPSTCGNDRGRVGSCSTLRAPGPNCESFADTQQQCEAFASGMHPKAAEKAVACLLARSGQRSICQFDVGQKCAVESLKSVCIEPYSAQPCRSVMSVCSGQRFNKLTLQQCQRALSAVKGRNRLSLVTCITESCAVDYCFYNLL